MRSSSVYQMQSFSTSILHLGLLAAPHKEKVEIKKENRRGQNSSLKVSRYHESRGVTATNHHILNGFALLVRLFETDFFKFHPQLVFVINSNIAKPNLP